MLTNSKDDLNIIFTTIIYLNILCQTFFIHKNIKIICLHCHVTHLENALLCLLRLFLLANESDLRTSSGFNIFQLSAKIYVTLLQQKYFAQFVWKSAI